MKRARRSWRWPLIVLAAIGFDTFVAILGVGFVTSQNNARDAIKAQRASAMSATARINDYRAQQARDELTIHRLEQAASPEERRKIVDEAAAAAIYAADQRIASSRPTTTTAPRRSTTSTTSSPRPTPTTTTSTTQPRRQTCVAGLCIGG